jgi:hypothetical protein
MVSSPYSLRPADRSSISNGKVGFGQNRIGLIGNSPPTGSNRARMAPQIIAQSAASRSNHFNQIEFLHSTGLICFSDRHNTYPHPDKHIPKLRKGHGPARELLPTSSGIRKSVFQFGTRPALLFHREVLAPDRLS